MSDNPDRSMKNTVHGCIRTRTLKDAWAFRKMSLLYVQTKLETISGFHSGDYEECRLLGCGAL
jgi:hypothetical protein